MIDKFEERGQSQQVEYVVNIRRNVHQDHIPAMLPRLSLGADEQSGACRCDVLDLRQVNDKLVAPLIEKCIDQGVRLLNGVCVDNADKSNHADVIFRCFVFNLKFDFQSSAAPIRLVNGLITSARRNESV